MAAAHRCISLLGRHQPPPPLPQQQQQQQQQVQQQQVQQQQVQQQQVQQEEEQQEEEQAPLAQQQQPLQPWPQQSQPPLQPQCPTTPRADGPRSGALCSASGTLLAVGTVLRMGHERGRVERFDEAGGW